MASINDFDIDELIKKIGSSEKSEVKPEDEAKAAHIEELGSGKKLNAKEAEFVKKMANFIRRGFPISEKQKTFLASILAKPSK